MGEGLPKEEKLCGKTAVGHLFEHGRSVQDGCIRCKYLLREDDAPSRILVSVPKRSFKRAVKRNLLKRRLRESYRRQKPEFKADMIFIYIAPEVLPYEDISACMGRILSAIK